ncbi:Hydroxymethylglutaryl-CoA reductase [Burkholderia vietnamiensis]|nr:Hydroxymethylglutaryl-CoA reductase [Burkholderia vietnamiensis]
MPKTRDSVAMTPGDFFRKGARLTHNPLRMSRFGRFSSTAASKVTRAAGRLSCSAPPILGKAFGIVTPYSIP